jgi:hypothetical protein
MGRFKRTAVAGAVVVAASFVASQIVADAHHPEVAIECLSGPSTIRITVRAWDAPTADEKVNHRVEVTIDGKAIAVVALTAANGYRAVVDHTAAAKTGTHTIRATATVPWGDNEDDPDPVGVGEYREATVTFPCADPAVGGAVTTTVPTTTVAPPSSTTTTTTTLPGAQVQGITVVAQPVVQQPVVARPTPPVAAQPVVTTPRLTG